MNCITWTAAQEYCTKMELGDLPSEAQWEKAARGTDRRLFPWGNTDVSCSRANYDSNGPYSQELGIGLGYGCAHEALPATWEVGHLTGYDGDSPYGLKDMAGNVDEWVLDCYSPTYYGRCASTGCLDPVNTECSTENDRVIRGGNSVFASSTLLTTVNRFPYGTDVVPTRVGFRCAKPDPAQPTR
jgi:formylglycine-generating enzyme required for sulfatase activity